MRSVVDAFVAWLQEEGWTAETEVDFADVFARRRDERLYEEAKGRTAAIGLDVDTPYGQLLRRMTHPNADARYAAVVPAAAVPAALPLPNRIREPPLWPATKLAGWQPGITPNRMIWAARPDGAQGSQDAYTSGLALRRDDLHSNRQRPTAHVDRG